MRSQSRARKIRRRNSPGRANSRRGRNEQTHRGSSSEDREQKDLRTSGSNGSVPFQIGPVTAMIMHLDTEAGPEKGLHMFDWHLLLAIVVFLVMVGLLFYYGKG